MWVELYAWNDDWSIDKGARWHSVGQKLYRFYKGQRAHHCLPRISPGLEAEEQDSLVVKSKAFEDCLFYHCSDLGQTTPFSSTPLSLPIC